MLQAIVAPAYRTNQCLHMCVYHSCILLHPTGSKPCLDMCCEQLASRPCACPMPCPCALMLEAAGEEREPFALFHHRLAVQVSWQAPHAFGEEPSAHHEDMNNFLAPVHQAKNSKGHCSPVWAVWCAHAHCKHVLNACASGMPCETCQTSECDLGGHVVG